MKIDFEKGGGLVPTIIQNADTEQVLMLGYMNEEAVRATEDSGFVTFYSRSRQCLWRKGETSGNTLALVDMTVDCDNDTVLVRARPAGPTCHTGTLSCFGDQGAQGFGWLADLTALIESRKSADPKTSYTAELLQGPLTKCAQKVGEEGVETVIAALAETDEALTGEAADLLYHLMVLLAAKNLTLVDVIKTLKSRS
ncbi:MAG: bifunctional phosphoribosyl-AMP cyclohydrolase/phosphoribosyl-ATP diphosphatase HisIE [Robiginitomaculum sp.]|nr:bifunctional phosphoribosyl-AMP cyclohydrolase/phosphoribosyl-ATP diphosphatase HisIE [Robiginitomaculum sp.]